MTINRVLKVNNWVVNMDQEIIVDVENQHLEWLWRQHCEQK